jgi:hypothetical protein
MTVGFLSRPVSKAVSTLRSATELQIDRRRFTSSIQQLASGILHYASA